METHTSNTNPQDVHAIPKIQITKETTFKNTQRTQPRFKAIYMRGQAETMSNQLMPNFFDQMLLKFT